MTTMTGQATPQIASRGRPDQKQVDDLLPADE
jgi:hypothetical protein